MTLHDIDPLYVGEGVDFFGPGAHDLALVRRRHLQQRL